MMRRKVVWDLLPCTLSDIYSCFSETCLLYYVVDKYIRIHIHHDDEDSMYHRYFDVCL
jgi:hypothetical protein